MKPLATPHVVRQLTDAPVPVRLKITALWASVLFLYIYGDYFELYAPGKLRAMLAGRMALGAVSQAGLLGMAALMAIPSVMVALTLLLPARLNRWVNFVLGLVYTGIMLLAIQGSWPFYQFYGALEMTLTLLISWYAWSWPRQLVPEGTDSSAGPR
ncbi:MAG: DUF6326 family protein [Bacteroidota bacterium]|nr:DUF6326 family protein [Bacteroidota bacterium]